ncbi:phosphoenolpyruvate carboxykinase (ATP), partial [Chloroflexota bacterium]
YQLANRIREKALIDNRLTENPSEDELREILAREPGIQRTKYDNFVAQSEPTSRSAMFTKNSVDHSFGKQEEELLTQCEEVLSKTNLISVDCLVGSGDTGTTVRLIVPETFAHIAYGGRNLFIPVKHKLENPTYQIIFFSDKSFEANKEKPLSEKDITIRLAMLEDGRFVKIIRNGNYIGEFKKGVFAAEDWNAKKKGKGIFLHAGCREDYLQNIHGDYHTICTLLVALSANGKTTTTSRILSRKGREKSWLVQDDGGTLAPDGSFHGFEAGGIFVKTEAVNPGEQAEIYYGLHHKETVCENVHVDEDGDFDFYNFTRTSNGRAVIPRKYFMHASQYIDVEKIDNLILITRGSLIPAICRLNHEQAVALMILGQAMESSAGDPTQAGKIRSEFFYDPFVVGSHAEHANVFYEITKGLPHLNYYLLNTGGVGDSEHYQDIRLDITMGILDSLVRGGLEDWIDSPSGFKVPRAIRIVDEIFLHPEKLFSWYEFEKGQKELNIIRHEALSNIGSALNPAIQKVFIQD